MGAVGDTLRATVGLIGPWSTDRPVTARDGA